MPYTIPTAYALRFVQNQSLKNRMKPFEKSYKMQIGSFALFGLLNAPIIKQNNESIFLLTYL
jgi:hypothetical protein